MEGQSAQAQELGLVASPTAGLVGIGPSDPHLTLIGYNTLRPGRLPAAHGAYCPNLRDLFGDCHESRHRAEGLPSGVLVKPGYEDPHP